MIHSTRIKAATAAASTLALVGLTAIPAHAGTLSASCDSASYVANGSGDVQRAHLTAALSRTDGGSTWHVLSYGLSTDRTRGAVHASERGFVTGQGEVWRRDIYYSGSAHAWNRSASWDPAKTGTPSVEYEVDFGDVYGYQHGCTVRIYVGSGGVITRTSW